jgi:hypothetical protein
LVAVLEMIPEFLQMLILVAVAAVRLTVVLLEEMVARAL